MSVASEHKKVQIRLKVTQQEHMEIEAYTSSAPGLVIHRQVRWSPGKEEHKFTSNWQVTHAESGLGLLTPTKCLPRMKDANKFANRIKNFADWTHKDAELFSNDESLLARIKGVYDGILREQEAEEAGEIVVDEEYKPQFTIERDRATKKYAVLDISDPDNIKIVSTHAHRGQAWKEAHRLNSQVSQ